MVQSSQNEMNFNIDHSRLLRQFTLSDAFMRMDLDGPEGTVALTDYPVTQYRVIFIMSVQFS